MMERDVDHEAKWAILRMAGPRTLPVVRSLEAAGFEVWTPTRTLRRVRGKGTKAERKVEVDAPILPTVVFAGADRLSDLAYIAADQASRHPAFSIFYHAGRIPLVSGPDVAGLRQEEERERAVHQAILDAETREEAEKIRIAAITSAAARRRAEKEMERERVAGLRAQRREFRPGARVVDTQEPAMVGVVGVVVSSEGPFAWVEFGLMTWKVEAWRLSPHDVLDGEALTRNAA